MVHRTHSRASHHGNAEIASAAPHIASSPTAHAKTNASDSAAITTAAARLERPPRRASSESQRDGGWVRLQPPERARPWVVPSGSHGNGLSLRPNSTTRAICGCVMVPGCPSCCETLRSDQMPPEKRPRRARRGVGWSGRPERGCQPRQSATRSRCSRVRRPRRYDVEHIPCRTNAEPSPLAPHHRVSEPTGCRREAKTLLV